MFPHTSDGEHFLREMKVRWKVSCVKNFLGDLLGIQYLFEILHTSLTDKNSETVVKSGCFESLR